LRTKEQGTHLTLNEHHDDDDDDDNDDDESSMQYTQLFGDMVSETAGYRLNTSEYLGNQRSI
jgi:hypothetical protein